jgi:hypothetical protein
MIDVLQIFYFNMYAENTKTISYENLLDLLNKYCIF